MCGEVREVEVVGLCRIDGIMIEPSAFIALWPCGRAITTPPLPDTAGTRSRFESVPFLQTLNRNCRQQPYLELIEIGESWGPEEAAGEPKDRDEQRG